MAGFASPGGNDGGGRRRLHEALILLGFVALVVIIGLSVGR